MLTDQIIFYILQTSVVMSKSPDAIVLSPMGLKKKLSSDLQNENNGW